MHNPVVMTSWYSSFHCAVHRSGDQPGEVPRAAAIFLHRFSYDAAGNSRPTSGCVSLAGDDLDAVLRALAPGEAWFVITG